MPEPRPDRCQATARNGKPCSAAALPGDPLCAWHSPAAAEQRRAWSAKGGSSRSNQARARKALLPAAMTVADMEVLLDGVLKAVVGGKLAPGVAVAAATVAKVKMQAAEAAAIETRLTALEAAAASDRWKAGA